VESSGLGKLCELVERGELGKLRELVENEKP